MNKSESIAALAKAMAAAQGEIENASKNTVNGHFKNRYADLAEVLNTIREPFSKRGLSFVQFPSFSDGVAHVETMLMHESGEWISSVASAPVSKHDAQGVGSAVTYLRRYSAAAMAGIAQEDDDGNGAAGISQQNDRGQQKQHSNATIGDAEFKIMNDLLDRTKSDKASFCNHFGVQSVAELRLSDFAVANKMLTEKLKKQESAQ